MNNSVFGSLGVVINAQGAVSFGEVFRSLTFQMMMVSRTGMGKFEEGDAPLSTS